MKSKSMFYARNKSIRIILSILFFFVSFTAFSQSGEKWSVGCNTVSGNAALGTINNFPLIIKTNNTQKAVFTPFGYFGLGITAPTCMLDVAGDGKIGNFNVVSNLVVGNILTVKKIVSPTGTVDFDANNITTTTGISGASLNITGTITANNINAGAYTNPAFAGSDNGIVTFNNDGCFQKLNFNNNPNTYLRGDGSFGTVSGGNIYGDTIYAK
ncbi:MAG: hypothetical protein HY958_14530, partial [Bacteroidia bacterium]|nr:hypothetical protein [Bacteroidia bacterium]